MGGEGFIHDKIKHLLITIHLWFQVPVKINLLFVIIRDGDSVVINV